MKQKHNVPLIIMLVLAIASAVTVSVIKDLLIIQMGIVFYRKIRLLVYFIAGILAVLSLILMVASRRRTAGKENYAEEQRTEKISQTADLSVRSGLDAEKIQELLQEKLEGEWGIYKNEIGSCLDQMKTMDRYQNKLNRLLKENGADTLNDTEEILERVEQYLCKNVRKVLNYMNVADTNDVSDQEMIQNKLKNCEEMNAVQLEQTQQFLFALTEFLNRQGDDDTGTEMLEMYRQTILDSLNREN